MHTDIRPAVAGDAAAIAALYNHYVLHTAITFEEEAVAAADIGARLAKVAAAGLPWLVAERDGELLGYAYATPWRERAAYRHSVESSVYLSPAAAGQGLGSRLYGVLIDNLRAQGRHAVIAGIALPNAASVALHERCGFVPVARFAEVGRKFDRWIDVGYWQLLL